MYREARYYNLQGLCKLTLQQTCIVVVGVGIMEVYNPQTRTWHACQATARPTAAAVVGGRLVIVNMDLKQRQLAIEVR